MHIRVIVYLMQSQDLFNNKHIILKSKVKIIEILIFKIMQ